MSRQEIIKREIQNFIKEGITDQKVIYNEISRKHGFPRSLISTIGKNFDLYKKPTQYETIQNAFNHYINMGITDKVFIYDRIQEIFGYPRPSIRKVSRYIGLDAEKKVRDYNETQYDKVKRHAIKLLNQGIRDKKTLYDKLEHDLKLPRPTIRKLYRKLKNENKA